MKELPVTKFDMLTINDSLQLFKALVPFLKFEHQKEISLIIRIVELNQTLEYYNHPENANNISSQNLTFNSSITELLNNDKFISTITHYCPDNYVKIINNIKNFTKISDILNMFGSFDETADILKNPSFFNLLNSECSDKQSSSDILKYLLTPKQQKEYNEYSKILKDL